LKRRDSKLQTKFDERKNRLREVIQNAHLKEENDTLIDLKNIDEKDKEKEFKNLFDKIR